MPTGPTKAPAVVVWLLVAACAAVDLAVVGDILWRRSNWPDPPGVLGFGLATGQMTLLAAWTIWGRENVLFRIALAALGSFALGNLLSVSTTGRQHSDLGAWFAVQLIYLTILIAAMLYARLLGYRLAAPAPTASVPVKLASHQFSIWGLLTAMTAVGGLLAVLRLLELEPLKGEWVEILLFFTVLAATSLLTFFAMFLIDRAALVLGIVVVAAPIAGGMAGLTGLAPDNDWMELVAMCYVHAITVFLIALILRTSGFRLLNTRHIHDVMARESLLPDQMNAKGRRGEP